MAWTLHATTDIRLSGRYTLDTIAEEVQVLSGQLDPEIVPLTSLYTHIDLCTFDVATLLNQVLAPWYGTYVSYGGARTWAPAGSGLYAQVPLPTTTVTGVSGGASYSAGLDKVLGLRNGYNGTCKRARDWSQFAGIAYGNNSQWTDSVVWLHYGNSLHLWVGSLVATGLLITTSSTGADAFGIYGLRNAAPLLAAPTQYIDIPDKYVSLVINKAVLWAMKQSRMGNWEEVEANINGQIASLQKEYEQYGQEQIGKSRNESIEGI